jgi:hypothetical protein
MPTLRALALLAAVVMGVVSPSTALASRTIRLRVPSFSVPPHSDKEVCTFVPVPMNGPFNFQKSLVVNVGGDKHFTTHHFLAWVYNGKSIDGFPKRGQIVESKACLDFGPADTNTRTLIVGAQTVRLETTLGEGLAQQMTPTVDGAGKSVLGIILNSHWINSSARPKRAAVKLRLTAAKPHTVRRFVQPIFEVTANAQIDVPPGKVHTEHGYWGPDSIDFGNGSLGGGAIPPKGETACVVGVTSHMHKRGTLFAIDLVQGPLTTFGKLGLAPETETVLIPDILRTTQYTDPPQVSLMSNGGGMPIHQGQYLRYTCTHDNTGLDPSRPGKMGCEEQAGVTPGKSIIQLFIEGKVDLSGNAGSVSGAARRCSSDSDCAGFGTGKCVPANLVFGFTSDDDMCIMPGGWYEADQATGGCDVMSFPVEPNG